MFRPAMLVLRANSHFQCSAGYSYVRHLTFMFALAELTLN
jgi:hypothetical protein